MGALFCRHCGGDIEASDKNCSHCGMPLPPGFDRSAQKKFILYFIVLVIFCVVMVLWLPPDWTPFVK